MKTFLMLCLAVLVPFSLASARSVIVEVSDHLTFQKINSYTDGTTAITVPKAYGYYLGVSTTGQADENAKVVCKMINKNYLNLEASRTGKQLRTVNFSIIEGRVSEPSFELGGRYETLILSKVFCR